MNLKFHRVQFIALMIIAILVCVLSVLRLDDARPAQAPAEQPYGRYTKEEMLNRAESSCQALMQVVRPLHLNTDKRITSKSDGALMRHWVVECAEDGELSFARFDWDADTGEIVEAVCEVQQNGDSAAHLPKPENAAREALRWAHVLGISESCHLVRVPERLNGGWLVSLHDKSRAFKVTLYHDTGRLQVSNSSH